MELVRIDPMKAIPGRFYHGDVIKWKHFPRYWPFVRGIHRPTVNSPHKGQWRGALMFSLICAWINGWVNNREAGDFTRYRAHCDVTVMTWIGYNGWDTTVLQCKQIIKKNDRCQANLINTKPLSISVGGGNWLIYILFNIDIVWLPYASLQTI